MPKSIEVTPYLEIPVSERNLPQTNWVLEHGGEQITDWTEIRDGRYGTVKHVRMQYPDGTTFDKINLEWAPAVFVVVYRRNSDSDGRIEYLLPTEKRPLLRDESGKQGNVSIKNIPQGLVKIWKGESAVEAALRETKEETGVDPITLTFMGNLYIDAANSETAMPYFLAEAPYKANEIYDQQLESTEQIDVNENDWYAIEDIPALHLQCAKTLAGIMLSTGFLGAWNKQTPIE